MISRVRWRIPLGRNDDGEETYDVKVGECLGTIYSAEKGTCLVVKGEDGFIHEVEITRFKPF
jgi:hypothetical protein